MDSSNLRTAGMARIGRALQAPPMEPRPPMDAWLGGAGRGSRSPRFAAAWLPLWTRLTSVGRGLQLQRRRTCRIFFPEPCPGRKQAPTPPLGSLLPGGARQCLGLWKGGRQRRRTREGEEAIGAAESAAGGTPVAFSSLGSLVFRNRHCPSG